MNISDNKRFNEIEKKSNKVLIMIIAFFSLGTFVFVGVNYTQKSNAKSSDKKESVAKKDEKSKQGKKNEVKKISKVIELDENSESGGVLKEDRKAKNEDRQLISRSELMEMNDKEVNPFVEKKKSKEVARDNNSKKSSVVNDEKWSENEKGNKIQEDEYYKELDEKQKEELKKDVEEQKKYDEWMKDRILSEEEKDKIREQEWYDNVLNDGRY